MQLADNATIIGAVSSNGKNIFVILISSSRFVPNVLYLLEVYVQMWLMADPGFTMGREGGYILLVQPNKML